MVRRDKTVRTARLALRVHPGLLVLLVLPVPCTTIITHLGLQARFMSSKDLQGLRVLPATAVRPRRPFANSLPF